MGNISFLLLSKSLLTTSKSFITFSLFQYAEGPLLDGLHWEKYYNGKAVKQSEKGYIYFENKLLGLPRLRQVRVLNTSCE